MGKHDYELTLEAFAEGVVIRAEGKFDRAAGEAVERLLTGREGIAVLNMSAVTYISSTGIAFLVKLSTSLKVQIAAPAAGVLATLSLAGIERLLSIHDDEAAARLGGSA